MFRAQASTPSLGPAVIDQANYSIVGFGYAILRPVNKGLFSMVLSYMFRLGCKFKILYTIIGFNMIKVVDFLTRQKFAPKVLFHYIAMMQHALSPDIDTKIAQRCNKRLSFLEHCPVRRDIVISVPNLSTAVHGTYEVSLSSWLIATVKFTNHYPYSSALCL